MRGCGCCWCSMEDRDKRRDAAIKADVKDALYPDRFLLDLELDFSEQYSDFYYDADGKPADVSDDWQWYQAQCINDHNAVSKVNE